MHSSKTWKPVYCPRCGLGFQEDGSFDMHWLCLCDFAEQLPNSPTQVSYDPSIKVISTRVAEGSTGGSSGTDLSYVHPPGTMSKASKRSMIDTYPTRK
jgi:hypothetical protein